MKEATKKFLIAILLVGLLITIPKPLGNPTPTPLGIYPEELYNISI